MTQINDQTQAIQTIDRQAIQASLQGKWEEAIELNKQIIGENPENTSALNRLGIAYLKTKQLQNAKKAFLKVLDIDQFNTIAKANLKKATPRYLAEYEKAIPLSNHTFSFIEESGKSKVIPLINIGEPQVVANLFTGLEVDLKIAARKVKVVTSGGQYIGSLPDDISIHLFKLIKAGNKYRSLIKSADTGNIQVFIRELKRAKRVIGVPSFTITNLDDLETSINNQPSQPPLEIYDPIEETQV
ncbi:tetratricopeptide repeat protein [Candidatus Woesebacteria bacterium]|nr:tetratricopeptide repeat protein [Candidatus Woesebacteria bacterium]